MQQSKTHHKGNTPSSFVLTVSHSLLTSLVFSQNREVRDHGVIFAKYYIRPSSVHTVPFTGLFFIAHISLHICFIFIYLFILLLSQNVTISELFKFKKKKTDPVYFVYDRNVVMFFRYNMDQQQNVLQTFPLLF